MCPKKLSQITLIYESLTKIRAILTYNNAEICSQYSNPQNLEIFLCCEILDAESFNLTLNLVCDFLNIKNFLHNKKGAAINRGTDRGIIIGPSIDS